MAGLYLLLLLIGAAALYRFRPAFSKPPVIDHSPRGLGGWLVLIILGLIATPFWCAHYIASNTSVLTVEDWQNLTLSGNANYHPLWGLMLTLELLGNLTLLVFALLLIVLFFQKRRTFPFAYVAFQVMHIVFVIADNSGCALIPSVAAAAGAKEVPTLTGTIIGGAVWIAYMLTSMRVKTTFVK